MIDVTPDPAEESAQGHDLFRAPGREAMIEDERDQALASGWIPPGAASSWTVDLTPRIVVRRRDLYQVMQELEAAAARASGQPDWHERVGQALGDLQATLEVHCAEIEADGGLFDEIIRRAPHLAHVVEDLRREHAELDEACQKAFDQAQADPHQLRRLILELLGMLAIHRQTGAELLYDAYNVEIGTGD